MRRLASPFLATASATLLAFAMFAPLFRGGRQFGFRDASQHYYPLYHRVDAEWRAGRLPLWDPWQNGGQPLLGNPTAAVLYPGKIAFLLPDFGLGMRVYVIGHVVLAAVGQAFLLRVWGASVVGATLAGLAYSYGGPVLGLHSNVIFLVGAAWMPWGIAATVAWIERGRHLGLVGLAAVLALQVLGGDPQSAYLTVLIAAALAHVAAAGEGPHREGSLNGALSRRAVSAGLIGLVVMSVLAARVTPTWREATGRLPAWWPPGRLIWAMMLGVGFVWGMAWLRRSRPHAYRRLAGLIAAGGLGITLSGAQLIPTLEFARESRRGAGGEDFDSFGFSLQPYRVAELVWPNVFGSPFPENRHWLRALPPREDATFWVPSLWMGGLSLILVLNIVRGRGRRPPVRVLTLLWTITLVGAMGKYAGPTGLGLWLPGTGSHPASGVSDGDGSPYWWLATVLPGFDLFRYPSKLLTPAALSFSAMAGLGWDAAARGEGRAGRIAFVLAVLGLVLLAGTFAARSPLLAAWGRPELASTDAGPLDARGALADLRRSLLYGSIVFVLAAALLRLASVRPRLAGGFAIVTLSTDLALANAGLVWTVPQRVYETEPKALAAIREAEVEGMQPASGLFRVHRPTFWRPRRFFETSSPNRLSELVAWERDTLQPLHGLSPGLPYALTLGILEDERYLAAFRPTPRPIGPALAGPLGLGDDEPVLYFPRRAFDLWGVRYFILPSDPLDWRLESRAFAAFLDRTEPVAPSIEVTADPSKRAEWWREQDWQILRNESAYPRAWVVHQVRRVRPFEELDESGRAARLRSLHYAADPIWYEPGRPVVDLRAEAWVESDSAARSARLNVTEPPPGAAESVTVVVDLPDRVEIEAELAAPGVVVLADVHAPGWTLEIDGRPAPILKVNHLMRGAALPAGRHLLIYRYDPSSFRYGAALSAIGLIVLIMATGRAVWRDRPAAGTRTDLSESVGPGV